MQWVAAVFIVILIALVIEIGLGIDLGIRDFFHSLVGSGGVDAISN
jgi:hypothetical protein